MPDPNKYWVLKGYHHHGGRLPTFFETYPDARVIWAHRDPVQVLASRVALSTELIEGLTGEEVAPKGQIPWQLVGLRATLQATMTDPLVMDPRVHHVRYQDIVADPVGRSAASTASTTYRSVPRPKRRCGLANNRGDRYGKFDSTKVIGDQIDALQAEFTPYRERFGIDVEQRK